MQDLSHFFNTQEIQRGNKKNPLPFNISGAEVSGLVFLLLFFCLFVFFLVCLFCFSSQFFRNIFKIVHFIKFIKYFHI